MKPVTSVSRAVGNHRAGSASAIRLLLAGVPVFSAALLGLGGCFGGSSPAADKAPAPANTKAGTAAAPKDQADATASTNTKADMTPKTPRRPTTLEGEAKITPLARNEIDWSKTLTPEQYHVLREKGTERAFTGKYWKTKPAAEQAKDQTVYNCAGCGLELFRADSKFDSGCGWPSFDRMIQSGVIKEVVDNSYGMSRTEVVCARCGGHLGHLFDDGPTSTGLRYCINSASIEPEKKDEAKTTPATPEPKKP